MILKDSRAASRSSHPITPDDLGTSSEAQTARSGSIRSQSAGPRLDEFFLGRRPDELRLARWVCSSSNWGMSQDLYQWPRRPPRAPGCCGSSCRKPSREIRRLMCCNPTSPALHENDDKAQAELYGQMTSSRSAQTRSRSRRRAEHNPLSRAGREVYAARRLSLLSAMAVSFLSAAFSSSRFC